MTKRDKEQYVYIYMGGDDGLSLIMNENELKKFEEWYRNSEDHYTYKHIDNDMKVHRFQKRNILYITYTEGNYIAYD